MTYKVVDGMIETVRTVTLRETTEAIADAKAVVK